MTSFYPGPSRVHDEIPQWVKAAHHKGIMSLNHRSGEFVAMSKKTIGLLKEKLHIPEDYTIFFTSSATECWEIIAQSLIKQKSIHLYNGAFGEKWFDYTRRLQPAAEGMRFDEHEPLATLDLKFKTGDVICLTQNETSNGTQVTHKIIESIGQSNPGHLLAIDATSSMAGIFLDFTTADVWFASVQKCFGLPAGLALLVCSPRAMKRIAEIAENQHYNSLVYMTAMMDKWQTPFTPNVLGIYLLMRSLKRMKVIEKIHQKTIARSEQWKSFFKDADRISLYVKQAPVRSHTVITIIGEPEWIDLIKSTAKRKGILLGEGYGDLRKTTFRIANFPALKRKEIQKLRDILTPFL